MATSNIPSNIYQFKISLKRIKPSIWRRIQVPEDYTFHQLHVAIQHAMGWSSAEGNYHLHQFVMKNPEKTTIGIPDRELPEVKNGKKVKIANYFSLDGNMKANYEYDFGDGWDHEVLLEKILPAKANTEYPTCTAGKRACPPEDCGGSEGYKELLEIMADPNHEEYEDKKEWLVQFAYMDEDETFDPEKFDPKYFEFLQFF